MSDATQTTPAIETTSAAEFVSMTLAHEIGHRLPEEQLGTIIESPPPFAPPKFVRTLAAESTYTIGIALVGIDQLDLGTTQEVADGTTVRVTADLSTAIKWRNGTETEYRWGDDTVPDRIVVLVRGDPPKINSLHRLTNIPLGAVRKRMAKLMQAQEPFKSNAPASELWTAIEDGLEANLSLDAIADYCAHTIKQEHQASLDALGTELPRLGLFADSGLLQPGEVRDRLEQNYEFVNRVRRITNRDRRRMTNSIPDKPESEHQKQAAFVERLRRFHRTNDESLLAELEFERVRETFEASSKSRSGGGSDGTTGSGSSGTGRRYTRRSDDATVAVELALKDQQSDLDELNAKFDKEYEKGLERDDNRLELTYGSDEMLLVDLESDLYYMLQRFIDEETFGGIIEGVTSRTDAIENINSHDVRKFRIGSDESAFSRLRDFADQYTDFEPLVEAIDEYVDRRAALIDALPRLLHSPLLSLISDADLRAAASDYLEAYQRAQTQLDKKYRALQDASSTGATRLLSEFLLLDTIVIESEAGRELILSPLHPLHLWKYESLAQEVTDNRDSLTNDEKEFLQETVEEQPHVLNSITIGGGRLLREKTYLIQSDEIASLPVYAEPDCADPGSNAYLWKYLIDKFVTAYPPAKARFRISIVDPIDPGEALHSFSEAAQSGMLDGATVEFAYIETEHQHLLDSVSSSEEEDILAVFGPDSGFERFTIQTTEARTYDDYTDHLDGTPQHCVVVNDRSSFFIEEFERDTDTSIHPLYIPKEFEYDAFEDEIKIRASTEGPLFSEYQDLVNQMANQRQKLHHAGVHELQTDRETIDKLLNKSIWTCLSTPAMNANPFWEANLISKERRGDREYAIYSGDIDLFVRTLRRLLNEYPIAPDDADIEAIAKRIVDVQQSGLLRLLTQETIGDQQSRNTKGLLGSVIAVRWLDEQIPDPKLIFSIDDPRTREWLNFGDATRRADYMIARPEGENALQLEIVEVKALDDPNAAFNIDQSTSPPTTSGNAVDQVIETVETIRSLFTTDENVATPPRRELLREQLYHELIGAEEIENKGEWADRINAVFREAVEPSVTARIASVEITTSDMSETEIAAVTPDVKELQISRLPKRTIVRLLMNGTDDTSPREDSTSKSVDQESENNATKEDEQATEGTKESGTKVSLDTSSRSDTAGGGDSVIESTSHTSGSTSPQTTQPHSFGDSSEYADQAEKLKRVLADYDVDVRAIDPNLVDVGPNIVRFKVELRPGEKQDKIANQAQDIAREMALDRDPIVHRLPGTKYVAVDIPRTDRDVVKLEEYLDTLPTRDETELGELPFIAGITPSGDSQIADLQDAPHMLVGGTTGSGKTVFLYSLLSCLLERQSTDDVRLAIIDPKLTNFIFCNPLPNLETDQVVTDEDTAYDLFEWIVEEEIPRRTEVLATSGSVDIKDHNDHSDEPLRPLVVIVDEYADLVDSLADRRVEFETNVRRIAQKARSVGIHLVISTQRPSANIIDTDLRANLDMRVAFRLPSDSDSRIILDESGAEDLAGDGDMLFREADELTRLQGTLVEADELRNLVDNMS